MSNAKKNANVSSYNYSYIFAVTFLFCLSLAIPFLANQQNVNPKGKQVQVEKKQKVAAPKRAAGTPRERMLKKNPRRKIQTDPHWKKRVAAFKEWAQCADKLITRTGKDPELVKVLTGIARHSGIGAPIDHRRAFRVAKRMGAGKQLFLTVPVLKEDNHIEYFRKMFKPRVGQISGGFYLHRSGILFLNTQIPLSCTWKGQVLLHEGGHAMHYITGKLKPINTKLNEEHRARLQDHKNMEKLGGEAYQKYLQKVMAYEWNIYKTEGRFRHTGKTWPEIKKLFGEKSKGFYEDAFRENAIWVHAIYKLIDLNLSDKQPYLIKLQLHRHVYGQ